MIRYANRVVEGPSLARTFKIGGKETWNRCVFRIKPLLCWSLMFGTETHLLLEYVQHPTFEACGPKKYYQAHYLPALLELPG